MKQKLLTQELWERQRMRQWNSNEGGSNMDYHQMTAPCGLACFNCTNYLANENEEARKKLERDTRLNGVPVEVMLYPKDRHPHWIDIGGAPDLFVSLMPK
jgi:hypothetical protein